jgi:hypothetical protein
MSRYDKRRVVWEFKWKEEIETIDHPGIQGLYFSTPQLHHQGMFMAVKDQLVAWKDRGPHCEFDRPVLRSGYHRERTSGAMDLYDPNCCNVTQLIPLDSLEDLYIHHMPDKNNQRRPDNVISTMDLHKRRMKVLLRDDPNKKLWVDKKSGRYDGINILVDEKDDNKSIPFDLNLYQRYVSRGGMMAEDELKELDWEEKEVRGK